MKSVIVSVMITVFGQIVFGQMNRLENHNVDSTVIVVTECTYGFDGHNFKYEDAKVIEKNVRSLLQGKEMNLSWKYSYKLDTTYSMMFNSETLIRKDKSILNRSDSVEVYTDDKQKVVKYLNEDGKTEDLKVYKL